MPALMHTPGAIHHYVKFIADGSTWTYLGTAEVSPEVEIEVVKRPIANDLAGPDIPFDFVYSGQTHTVLSTLNRFDFDCYKRVIEPMRHDSTQANRGFDTRLDVGSRVLGNGSFALALAFDFSGTANATTGLPAGRVYGTVTTGGSRELMNGNRVMAVSLRFNCHRSYNPTTRSFSIYTEDFTGLTLTPN